MLRASQDEMATTPPPKKKQCVAPSALPAAQTRVAPSPENAAPALLTVDRTWAAAEKITAQARTSAIPLTILTGFLGAGKSTILNYILRAPHKLRIAVLINEFGAVDIDSQLVDTSAAFQEEDPVILDNGCICCTVSDGFTDALHRIIKLGNERGKRPDYIVVETTGLANPKPIIDSVQNTELRDDLYVDQVLVAVDSSAWTPEHYDSPTARSQVANADTVLLTKTDLVHDEGVLHSVIDSILGICPHARILRSQAGYVPVWAIFDLNISSTLPKERNSTGPTKTSTNGVGTGVAASSVVLSEHDPASGIANDVYLPVDHIQRKDTPSSKCCFAVDKDCSKHDSHHSHEMGGRCTHSNNNKESNLHLAVEGFTSISFVSRQPLSLRRFRRDFMEALPDGVFRAKGLLWFHHYASRFIFHWSGSRFSVDEGDWPSDAVKQNQLVIIGRNIDHDMLTTMLNDCVVRSKDDGNESENSNSGEEAEPC